MKLASLKEGGRDGTLVVVSWDLVKAVRVPWIAPTLQAALDRWDEVEAPLKDAFHRLDTGRLDDQAFPFDPAACAAPLPRACQWADGSAYVNHVELVRKARGAEMPASFWTDPLMYQGGSDRFVGPRDPIELADESWGCDFESEVAVVTDDVPMGVSPDEAVRHIKLVMLVNDVSLRNLIPGELAKGFGFFQSKPAIAFSPVACNPDALGNAWDGRRIRMPLRSFVNGTLFGEPNAGVDMTFDFARLIAHAARTRHLGAGTIIGSGTVSNRDRSAGSSCIAERRMIETIDCGEPATPFLRWGDRVRIEMVDDHGINLFGTIDQEVVRYRR
jgi:fumarylacetoacetate (FAA) hydrolase